MSRLRVLYLFIIATVNLLNKNEGCQDFYTAEEASTTQVYASEGGRNGAIYASTEHPYASEGGSDDDIYFASHASFPGKPYDEYYGFVATIDVYGYNLSRGQMSASSIWVANLANWTREKQNTIRVGWMVSPEIYGDSHTHFYTHWMRDGYGEIGCYNMDCRGFELQEGSKITPGAIINSSSTTGKSGHTITIKVYKDKESGNWWLYCGMDNDTPTAVGYYPADIFTTLADKSDAIAFGGESRAKRSLPTPPMGRGLLPSENAASFSNLQFVDKDGHATLIQSDLPIIADNPKCYYLTPIIGSKFFYGGPAGCF